MSTLWGAIVTAVVVVPVAVVQCRRALRHEARRARFLREQAAAVREVNELERILGLPAYDPAWDAGRERLWDAVRDAQHKGDQ